MYFTEKMYYIACATTSGMCHGMEMEGFRKDEFPSLCLSRRSAETHDGHKGGQGSERHQAV